MNAAIPSPDAILEAAAAVAVDWRWLAIAWHVLLGAFLLGLAAAWRPSQRVVRVLLTLPLVSVAALAWASGNVFTGPLFAIVSMVLLGLASRSPADPVRLTSLPWLIAGSLLVAFGWAYPHFLPGPWSAYLYAAPLGLLPCPTLAAVVGVSLMVESLRSGWWSAIVTAASAVYGLIGVFALGVEIDIALLAGAMLLGIAAATGDSYASQTDPVSF